MRWNHVMKGIMLLAAWAVTTAKAENITFADANVKALCVANWDTDGDGELSTDEAAAVKTLGTVFKGQTNITTFDELRYFTGVTAIGEDAFRGSSIGASLTIPGTVKEISNYAFNNCQRLNRVRLEEGVEVVGSNSFSGPVAYISFPSTITYIKGLSINPYINGDPGSGIFVPEGDLWVYSYAKSPANIHYNAFYFTSGTAHLIVPINSIDAYKAVAGWSHFGEYFELGDVNRDKVLEDKDLDALISYIHGNTPATFYADMADINGDSQVDEMDVLLLRNHLHPILMGDVNGDGAVNVLDVTTLVSYVLNEPQETFVEAAADVNGDGNINTLDVTKLVSIILQSSN